MYSKLTDLDLAQLVREDNREAYTELYNRYALLLLNHAYNKTQDRDEAKDIVQEVFTTLWGKRKELVFSKNLSGFLYTSVRNVILNQIARQGVQQKYLDSMRHFATQGIPVVDQTIREKELALLIESEIERLSPKMREVFELSRKEHLSHQEIAIRLGLSEQTVSKHITNALKILRDKFGVLVYLLFLFR
ncbi:MAG: RNA polymerase sigma-70 factor [Sphingobacterium sp.]|jgi:RNA polymerase sigma-70 factor (ECF subfamily)|nr:RNA polymerase sigma-70 factor [Sphingobacterium sp.]